MGLVGNSGFFVQKHSDSFLSFFLVFGLYFFDLGSLMGDLVWVWDF